MKQIFTLIMIASSVLTMKAQCIDDGHSTFRNSGWKSCTTDTNPVNGLGDSHWLRYDLGEAYVIDSIQLWNHNVWGETGKGVKEVQVHYSMNGSDWADAGAYQFAEAPGSWKYVSKDVIAIGNVDARYFLLTVLDTWDGQMDCAGIAEIKFIIGSETTSTIAVDEAEPLAIYPNPAAEYITVSSGLLSEEGSTIQIFNSLGSQLMSVTASPQNRRIDVSDLLSGVYVLRLSQGEKMYSRSFVKM